MNICILPSARSSHYGINSVQLRGSLLWNNLPRTGKQSVSVKEFKQKLDHIQKIHWSFVLFIMSVLVFAKLDFISLVTIK